MTVHFRPHPRGGDLSRTSVDLGVPVSFVRAVRDAGSARHSGATPHLHVGFGLSEIIHRKHSPVSHVSQSSRRHVEQSRCMQRRRHTLRTTDTPTHRHTTHNGRLSRTIGHRTANTSPHRWGGGRIPHTPEQRRHLTRQRSLDVAGALPSPIAFSTAACGHAPRRAGLGGRPRSRTRCGHARWLRWLRA